MPFNYPLGHPLSLYYYAVQYGDDFIDFGYTQYFFGTNNENWLNGDAGGDIMWGFGGYDQLFGHGGTDVLYGGDGNDLVSGGDHQDYLFGGDGNDFLLGAHGNDFMWGEGGDDRLYGGVDSDVLFGGDGEDVLNGSGGVDVIFGGANSDIIAGGDNIAAGDTLSGGGGDDRFVFWKSDLNAGATGDSGAGGNGMDIITDFDQVGDDELRFEMYGTGSFSAIQNTDIPEMGYGTFLWVYDGRQVDYIVYLEGVDATTVTADDVVFF